MIDYKQIRDVELRRYVVLLRRWAWLLVLGALLAGAIAFVVSRWTVPVYESSVTVLINQAGGGDASPTYASLLTGESLAKTYVELLRKRPVLEAVIADLKFDVDAETLNTRIRTSAVRDTQLIALTVEDANPQRAANIANQIVKVFSQQNRELQISRNADVKQSIEQELAKIQADTDRTQVALDALKAPANPDQAAEQSRLQVLLLAGQGRLEIPVRAEAAAAGLGERIRFLGVRRDVPQLMNGADAYVMSSAWEGMPMVLLEAAAVGLATVATAVGGNREVVLEGESGFLAPPRDPSALAAAMGRLDVTGFLVPSGDVRALSSALATLIDDRQARRRMGDAGRAKFLREFAAERMLVQLESLYGRILGESALSQSVS